MDKDITTKVQLDVVSESIIKINVTFTYSLHDGYQRKNSLDTGPTTTGLVFFDRNDNILHAMNSSSLSLSVQRTIDLSTGNFTQVKNPYGADHYEFRVFYDNYQTRQIYQYTYTVYSLSVSTNDLAGAYFFPDAKNWQIGHDPFQQDTIFNDWIVSSTTSFHGFDTWKIELDTIPSGYNNFEFHRLYEKNTGLFLQYYYKADKTNGFTALDNQTLVDVHQVLDNKSPQITPDYDSSMEIGDYQNVSWTISELHPESYTLLLNGTPLISKSYVDGVKVTYQLTASNLGDLNFTLVVTDTAGHQSVEQTIVTVVDTQAPTISKPNDLDLKDVTRKELQFGISDNGNGSYELFDNGSSVLTGQFSQSSNVTFSLSDIKVGYHNFTLIAQDDAGNFVKATVFVTFSADSSAKASLPVNFMIMVLAFLPSSYFLKKKRLR